MSRFMGECLGMCAGAVIVLAIVNYHTNSYKIEKPTGCTPEEKHAAIGEYFVLSMDGEVFAYDYPRPERKPEEMF